MCSSRWKLHAKLTFVVVVGGATAVSNAGAGVIVVLGKQMETVMRNPFRGFPQRPTL